MTNETSPKTPWKCPNCEAVANECGDREKAMRPHEPGGCSGIVCECEEGYEGPLHGEDESDPCPFANCHHCGWGGTLPQPKYKYKGWAKKAYDHGWRPPQGWVPPDEVIAK